MRYLLPLLALTSGCNVEVSESAVDIIVSGFSLGGSFARTGASALPPEGCVPLSSGATVMDTMAFLARENKDALTGTADLPLVIDIANFDLSDCDLSIEPNPDIALIAPVVMDVLSAGIGLAIAVADAANLPETSCVGYQWMVEGLDITSGVVQASLDAVASGRIQVDPPTFLIDIACDQ